MSALITDKKILKRLKRLVPINAPKLHEQIYKEILIPGDQFRKGEEEKFKKGIELFGEIMMIHREFNDKNSFGDLFGEWIIDGNEYLDGAMGQFFTPINICDAMAAMLLGDDEEKLRSETPSILDPACGTGRFMLRTAKYYAEKIGMFNFLFTNIDIDRRMFVYATMNAILNAIPSVNIQGNFLTTQFWDCFVTIPIGGLCMWKRVDAKVVEKNFIEMIPKRGQQSLGGHNVIPRMPSSMKVYTKDKPEQRKLFEEP